MTINELITAVDNSPARSAWARGVKNYAVDMLADLRFEMEHGYADPDIIESPKLLHKALLNGANDWKHYSWSGCSLCYNYQIAEALCTPSELKRTKNGYLRPNAREEWLDVQARALYQAEMLIHNTIKEVC